MTTNAHTPTPWSAEFSGGRGAWIKGANSEWSALACGDTDDSANHNAAFIVRAVNAHEELVAALKQIASQGGNLSDAAIQSVGGVNDGRQRAIMYLNSRDLALAALAKLEAAT